MKNKISIISCILLFNSIPALAGEDLSEQPLAPNPTASHVVQGSGFHLEPAPQIVYASKPEPTPEPTPIKKDDTLPESGVTYIRLGRSISTNTDSSNSTSLIGSIGHRRISDSFLYGGEYSYHYMDGMKYSEYNLLIGYRPTTKLKVVPYAAMGFGLTFSSDSQGLGRDGGNGIDYFGDIGADFIHFEAGSLQMKISAGIKMTKDVLTSGTSSQLIFTDCYVGFGVSW